MGFIRTLNNEWVKVIDIEKFEHKQLNDEFVLDAFIKDRRYVIRIFNTEEEVLNFMQYIDEELLFVKC